MSATEFNKPYEITFEHRSEYLYAYISGEKDSYEISRQFWLEIAAECNKNGCKKLLVEEDIVEPIPSLTEVFQGAAERSYMGLSGIKIAFVDRYIDHHEQNMFGELVATNRGLFCRVFSDFEQGEKWLTSD